MSAKILWLCFFAALVASSQVQGKRISQIKCDEYIAQTMTKTSVISLIFNPKPIIFTSFNCSKTVDLIIGGDEAKKAEFRHQVLLGWKTNIPNKYQFDCGGTLISDRYVLTAAHCASRRERINPAPVVVRFAEHNLTKVEDEFDIAIEAFIRHPEHSFRSSYHDIALVRLVRPVPFSNLVRPACLWDNEETNFTSVIATGFGKMEAYDYSGSDTLRKVKLDIMHPDECASQFLGLRSFSSGIHEGQLCVGSKTHINDTCQGDSGGPIQVLVNPKGCIYHVVGVTSTGSSCGSKVPAVYTNVAKYIDWIEEVVWGA